MRNSSRYNSGFSLIEVLVAVVVVAIGVLGVIAMQGATIKSSVDSSLRTGAAAFGEQIVEAMRANPTQLAAYDGAIVGTGSHTSSVPSPDCSQIAANCTPQQLVNWDLYTWEYTLMGKDVASDGVAGSGGLVDARGCITVSGNSVKVVVAWRGGAKMTDAADTTGESSCGAGNSYRRQHVIQTFIST